MFVLVSIGKTESYGASDVVVFCVDRKSERIVAPLEGHSFFVGSRVETYTQSRFCLNVRSDVCDVVSDTIEKICEGLLS